MIIMRKFLLPCMIAFGAMTLSAQTYCVPAFSYGCDDDHIDSFEISAAAFSHMGTGCSAGAYDDFSATHTISLAAGVDYNFTVSHGYEDQQVRIWADFDNNGTFDEVSEVIGSAGSGFGFSSAGIVYIPTTVAAGNYRLRIATRYASAPIPCNVSGFGEAHDYTLTVTAPPTCMSPSGVTSTGITTNGASIEWVASTSMPTNGYQVYYSTTNAVPTSATVLDASNSATAVTSPVVLSALTPATTYYYWVRSVCSISDQSLWASGGSFTTACAAIVPNYTNTFSVSFPGNCWSIGAQGTPATGPTSAATIYYNWEEYTFLDGDNWLGGSGSAALNLYYVDRAGWLISPVFDLSGPGDKTLTFNYGITEYGDTTPSAMGSDDVINVLASTDGGNTWSVVHTWTAADNISNTSNAYTYAIPTALATSQTRFAIYGTDGTVDDSEDYLFFVDDFAITTSSLSTSEVVNDKGAVKVYPNPFTEYVMVSDIDQLKSVKVLDMAGRTVRDITAPSRQLQLSDLKPGMYMLQLQYSDGSVKSAKVIKK